MADLNLTDLRPPGYEDPEGTRPTAFRRRLEKEYGSSTNPETRKPLRARRKDDTEKIPPPPAGYEKPTTWKRVAEAPVVVMATPMGWKPCQHHLTLKEVEKPDGTKRKEVRGEVGRITLGVAVYLEVRLASLRVPGRGDKGREGAA